MRYEEVELTRDCEMVQVPQGTVVNIPAGTPAVITQALGESYTVQLPTLGGLYKVAGSDADALGKQRVDTAAAEAAAASGTVDEDAVWGALRNVYDPEIPVNIVDLGLVYDMRIEPRAEGGNRVSVQMTLTAPGCGMGTVIASDAKACIERVPGVSEAQVDVVWEPAWNPHMISAEGKARLGMD